MTMRFPTGSLRVADEPPGRVRPWSWKSCAHSRLLGLAACLLVTLLSGCTTGSVGSVWSRKPPEEPRVQVDKVLAQTEQALDKGDAKTAEIILRQGVRSHPDSALLRWELVKLLLDRGEVDDATAHLRYVVAGDADEPEGFVRLARTLYESHRYGDADRLVSLAMDRDPDCSAALVLKGRLDEEWGETDRALSYYHRALRATPPPLEALQRIAAIHLERGRPEQSIPILCLARDNSGSLTEAERRNLHWQLGVAYAQLLRWPDAVGELTRGVEPSPTADQMYHLAYARMQTGDLQGASRDLAAALHLQPQHTAALALQGQLSVQSNASVLPAGHVR